MSTDELLSTVHERLGGLGLDITTYGTGDIEIRWRRLYEHEECSDERQACGTTLDGALNEVLKYEDWADAGDAKVIAREAKEGPR